jgi:hypothetical protein
VSKAERMIQAIKERTGSMMYRMVTVHNIMASDKYIMFTQQHGHYFLAQAKSRDEMSTSV